MATPSKIPRPYRDYLIPRLHERFSKTALYTLPACYVAAVSMSSWSMLMWLPYGSNLLRTLLLLVSVLMVLIIRISNVHIGTRNADCPAQTAFTIFSSFRWFHTLLWYSVSAWLFSEVFIWSAANSMALGWIDQGKSYERPKLNERPVFVRTIFFLLAVAQTSLHLFKDYDHTPLPTEEPKPAPLVPTEPNLLKQTPRLEIYNLALRKCVYNVVNTAPWRVGYLVLATVFYFTPLLPIRYFAVEIHRVIAQQNPMWTIPKYGEISSFKEKGNVMLATMFNALLLSMVWESCNTAFSILVVQPPLKSGKLITSIGPDPNAALIVGLKARRELVRNMAFWELAILAKSVPDRRKAIFAEFDRPGGKGSSWSQIFNACSAEIGGINQRVNPPPPATVRQAEIQSLPRISDQSVQNENISANPAPVAHSNQAALASFAKSIGQSPGSSPPFISPGRKLIEGIPDSKTVKELDSTRKNVFHFLIHSVIGWPFRHTLRRRLNTVIHDAPIGHEWSIRHAATALSHLVTNSLKEDEYGQVQKDVPAVVRLFVANIKIAEKYLQTLQPHWTDVNFKSTDRAVPEVLETLAALRSGLEGVLGAFAEYLQSIGLSAGEVAEARRAASTGPQMEKASVKR